jgi:hypothetical protein
MSALSAGHDRMFVPGGGYSVGDPRRWLHMRLAIALVLLIATAFLLAIMVVALRKSSRMGDETPGWTRVHWRLPVYKFPERDRPVKLWPDSENRRDDDAHG